MDAAQRLAEYARLRNEAVASGHPGPLVAMFSPAAEIVFHGVPVPPVRGAAAIEQFFRQQREEDRLVLGPVVAGPPGRAHSVFGWARAPGGVGGTVRLAMAGGLIARLDVVMLRDGPKPPSPRQAARALLVSPAQRVLLLRCTEPATGATWWITPGGGLEPGETEEQAMRRELREEVGIEIDATRRHRVWTREHVFTWGQNAVRQRETYFLLPLDREIAPVPQLSADRLAAEGLGEASRWWSPDEMRGASDDVFAPRRFPELLAALLRDGPPATPVDVGI